jgi:hypothetical protein
MMYDEINVNDVGGNKYHILRCYSFLCQEELREAISTDYLVPGQYYVVVCRNRL